MGSDNVMMPRATTGGGARIHYAFSAKGHTLPPESPLDLVKNIVTRDPLIFIMSQIAVSVQNETPQTILLVDGTQLHLPIAEKNAPFVFFEPIQVGRFSWHIMACATVAPGAHTVTMRLAVGAGPTAMVVAHRSLVIIEGSNEQFDIIPVE